MSTVGADAKLGSVRRSIRPAREPSSTTSQDIHPIVGSRLHGGETAVAVFSQNVVGDHFVAAERDPVLASRVGSVERRWRLD
jgi:hypothetical protein